MVADTVHDVWILRYASMAFTIPADVRVMEGFMIIVGREDRFRCKMMDNYDSSFSDERRWWRFACKFLSG